MKRYALLASQFLGKVRLNSHLTRLHMHAASVKSDTMMLDVRFFVYQWGRQRGGCSVNLSTQASREPPRHPAPHPR